MDLEVRAGTEGDIESLAPLWMGMVEHHRDLVGKEWPVRGSADAWAMRREEYRRWLGDGSGVLLVAWRAGVAEPVGYAFCVLIRSGPTFDFGPERGDVESLAVANDARGTGVGTALLEAAREEFRRRGVSYWAISVVEANADAARLYERVGFRPWTRYLLAPID